MGEGRCGFVYDPGLGEPKAAVLFYCVLSCARGIEGHVKKGYGHRRVRRPWLWATSFTCRLAGPCTGSPMEVRQRKRHSARSIDNADG